MVLPGRYYDGLRDGLAAKVAEHPWRYADHAAAGQGYRAELHPAYDAPIREAARELSEAGGTEHALIMEASADWLARHEVIDEQPGASLAEAILVALAAEGLARDAHLSILHDAW